MYAYFDVLKSSNNHWNMKQIFNFQNVGEYEIDCECENSKMNAGKLMLKLQNLCAFYGYDPYFKHKISI